MAEVRLEGEPIVNNSKTVMIYEQDTSLWMCVNHYTEFEKLNIPYEKLNRSTD